MMERHDDMLGVVRSATSGGTAWQFAALGDSGFLMGQLVNNSTDILQLTIQVPHWRKLGSNLDSIHMHVVNELEITTGQTIVLDVMSYVWLRVGDVIPATADWNLIPDFTYTASTNIPAKTYMLWSIATNVPPPPNEGYGGMLLIKVRRGPGSSNSDLGIIDVDAHSIKDRMGSINEAWD